jgi:class 3 adenylate cyclase
MPMDSGEPYPLPEDPTLADVAKAVRDSGQWAWVVDARWRIVYITDELRRSNGAPGTLAAFAIGEHLFGPAALSASESWRFGSNTSELYRSFFLGVGGMVLTDTPGGRVELRALVDAGLRDLVEDLIPSSSEAIAFVQQAHGVMGTTAFHNVVLRVRRPSGQLAGSVVISKPAAGMDALAAMTFNSDLRHLERMSRVGPAGRRPAAILFADLEGSSRLAKRLSTASYFALGRRLVRAADRCVIDAGGLVGRHVGDGVVAFFLEEVAGSESAAVRSCIGAARALTDAGAEVAVRSELQRDDIVLRFGLHWGSTLYIGLITTGGRVEVTALGDDVNETARIEACATGGRALASKALIERLTRNDAAALGLHPDRLTYTMLGDLTTATDKARRDAPSIAVCEV